MKRANPSLVMSRPLTELDDFFAALKEAPHRLLMLDYDGTLAPFHVNPAWAKPYEGVAELLERIMNDRRSTVVMVSGRPARDLLHVLELDRRPTIWGSHGWECLNSDGEYRCGPLNSNALQRVMRDAAWVQEVREAGGRIERKPGSIAIHWRGLHVDAIKWIRTAVTQEWASRDLDAGLQWMDFNGGIELRLPGRNKGFVVETLLKEHPNALAAYLGDDLTDEDAFKAIKGRGLGVLVRAAYRPTFAQAWLRPPDGILRFLERWRALGASPAQ